MLLNADEFTKTFIQEIENKIKTLISSLEEKVFKIENIIKKL